jgi:fatty acid synthase, animal type
MATEKPFAKVVVKLRENNEETQPIRVIPRVSFTQDECVVVVGGLGGFGVELGSWLVKRGCRKLIVSSRSGVTNGYQAMRIR